MKVKKESTFMQVTVLGALVAILFFFGLPLFPLAIIGILVWLAVK